MDDKQKIEELHTIAAKRHQQAAEHHLQAASHHKAGECDKGDAAAHKAHGHTVHALEHASKAAKHRAGIASKE